MSKLSTVFMYAGLVLSMASFGLAYTGRHTWAMIGLGLTGAVAILSRVLSHGPLSNKTKRDACFWVALMGVMGFFISASFFRTDLMIASVALALVSSILIFVFQEAPAPVDSVPPEAGRYKHYKGGTYQMLFMAKHSETLEDIVIYQNLEHGSYWARPLSEWNKPVEGSDEPRFKPDRKYDMEGGTGC